MYSDNYSQPSFDPLIILGILAAVTLCIICACCAFFSGAGIGYYARTVQKPNIKNTNSRPVYQQVDVEESEQQV